VAVGQRASALHVIAESMRTQLGTDAMILLTARLAGYEVVMAQAADGPARRAR
jgi:hypothetical protein